MLKHLSWIPWITAILLSGIIICAVLIMHMLLSQPHQPAYTDAVLVMEGFTHALA